MFGLLVKKKETKNEMGDEEGWKVVRHKKGKKKREDDMDVDGVEVTKWVL